MLIFRLLVWLLVFATLGGCQPMLQGLRHKQAAPIHRPLVDKVTGRPLLYAKAKPIIGMPWRHPIELDVIDASYIARVLDVQRSNREAQWVNHRTGVEYRMMPKDIFFIDGYLCRRFKLRVLYQKKKTLELYTACRHQGGVWQASDDVLR